MSDWWPETVIGWMALFASMLLFRINATIQRLSRKERDAEEPRIPTALEDWDAEFERLTGVPPFPEIKVRTGTPAIFSRSVPPPKLSVQPGDVTYFERRPRWYSKAENGKIMEVGEL